MVNRHTDVVDIDIDEDSPPVPWPASALVAADLGGASEIVSNDCGFVVPRGDLGRLTRALAMLMRDPQLRSRLGAAGPAHAAARCAPEVVLPRIWRALKSVDRTAAA